MTEDTNSSTISFSPNWRVRVLSAAKWIRTDETKADTGYYSNHTTEALVDELVLLLSSKCNAEVVEQEDGSQWIYTFHPYLQQAEERLYKTNVYKPLHRFVIFPEDIPEGLTRELEDLGKVKMNQVITNAVRRLYESVNPEYYHTNGIYGKVKWETTKKK